MQKQSKNYISRAKRSVQGGQEPDEEPLHKARKLHKELLELDEQKLAIATVNGRSFVGGRADWEGWGCRSPVFDLGGVVILEGPARGNLIEEAVIIGRGAGGIALCDA
jgi:hypothetical protein